MYFLLHYKWIGDFQVIQNLHQLKVNYWLFYNSKYYVYLFLGWYYYFISLAFPMNIIFLDFKIFLNYVILAIFLFHDEFFNLNSLSIDLNLKFTLPNFLINDSDKIVFDIWNHSDPKYLLYCYFNHETPPQYIWISVFTSYLLNLLLKVLFHAD